MEPLADKVVGPVTGADVAGDGGKSGGTGPSNCAVPAGRTPPPPRASAATSWWLTGASPGPDGATGGTFRDGLSIAAWSRAEDAACIRWICSMDGPPSAPTNDSPCFSPGIWGGVGDEGVRSVMG